jgi:hypothetical protein
VVKEEIQIIQQAVEKPNVEQVSVIDDHHSGLEFRQAEDPYEGKSFSDVLREKREALERQLKAQT